MHLGDVDGSARLRLEALARYLQDVATDDADDAQLSERNGVWVVRRVDVELGGRPWYHDRVELATFCSGSGPRWAERRTTLRGARGDVIEVVALWVFVDRRHGRPLPLDDSFFAIYGEAAGGRKVRGRLRHDRPPPGIESRPWSLRESDFDVLDHVNNARYLEAVEDELAARLPERVPVRASIEYRGAVERGDAVELAGEIRVAETGEPRARGLDDRRRRRADVGPRHGVGSRRPSPRLNAPPPVQNPATRRVSMTRSDDDHAWMPTRSPVAASRPWSVDVCFRLSTCNTSTPLTSATRRSSTTTRRTVSVPYMEAGSTAPTRAIGFHISRSACHWRTR